MFPSSCTYWVSLRKVRPRVTFGYVVATPLKLPLTIWYANRSVMSDVRFEGALETPEHGQTRARWKLNNVNLQAVLSGANRTYGSPLERVARSDFPWSLELSWEAAPVRVVQPAPSRVLMRPSRNVQFCASAEGTAARRT